MSIRLSFVFGFAVAAPLLQANPADDAYLRQKLAQAIDPRAAPTPTPTQPLGDEHVALLAQELDDVASAGILFKRCIDQDRPNAQVIKAGNVLADSYERFCVHMSQFYFWFNYWAKTSGKTSDFSMTAQNRFHDLSVRINTTMQDSMSDISDALEKKPEYTHDPALIAVAKRMLTAANKMKALIAQADKQ